MSLLIIKCLINLSICGFIALTLILRTPPTLPFFHSHCLAFLLVCFSLSVIHRERYTGLAPAIVSPGSDCTEGGRHFHPVSTRFMFRAGCCFWFSSRLFLHIFTDLELESLQIHFRKSNEDLWSFTVDGTDYTVPIHPAELVYVSSCGKT